MTALERLRRRAPRYYALQGAAIATWWAMIWAAPSTRRWFFGLGAPQWTLLGFVPPDFALAAASLWAALRPRNCAPAWFVAGAALYATLASAGAAGFVWISGDATGLPAGGSGEPRPESRKNVRVDGVTQWRLPDSVKGSRWRSALVRSSVRSSLPDLPRARPLLDPATMIR